MNDDHAATDVDWPPNPSWQHDAREAMRMDFGYRLRSVDLDRAIRDYLDHHGDLTADLADQRDEDHDDLEVADRMRAALHRHLLVITLLLERVDCHEWHRSERRWHDEHATTTS